MQATRIITAMIAVLTLSTSASAQAVVYEGTRGPGLGKHIVLLAGDHEYRSEETLPALARILAKHHGFKCTVLFNVDPDSGEIVPGNSNMPGMEAMDSADLAVVFLRYGTPEDLLNDGYRRMMVNGCFWALGLEDSIKPDADIAFVGPFKPNTFGNGTHARGIKPAVYAGYESPIPANQSTPNPNAPATKKNNRRKGGAAMPAKQPNIVFIFADGLRADEWSAQREQVLALGQLTDAPATSKADGIAEQDGLRAIYFDALPWQGKPTRTFAWLGMPANRAGKVPGVVLVHGGGGTAFKEWVKKWNDRGFAAISIAVEGQTDEREPSNGRAWQRHRWAGPARDGIYGDSSEPLHDQWMYHAVADTVLANSLLRSLPEVDADKVGLMGISWGGVITSTVIGIDERFAFAIPTYGCGHLFDADNQYGKALGNNELYRNVWDPLVRMNRARLPVLWLSWPQDQHFPLDCQAACYRTAPGPHLVSLIPNLRHGHEPPWNAPDSYAYAKSIVEAGKAWCHQSAAMNENGIAKVTVSATKSLDRAILVSTTDLGITGDRTWIESPAKLEQHGNNWHASAALPAGTTAWFINVRSGELTGSSDYQENH